MADIPLSREELECQLAEQLEMMQTSAELFDRGSEVHAKQLATHLRTLCHSSENRRSKSRALLEQLAMLDRQFLSSTIPHDERNLATHQGLVMIATVNGAGKYIPHLDGAPYRRWIPFADWWNETVLVDDRKTKISRRDLVHSTADQDGGAHVDAQVNETHYRLTRENSMGWTRMRDGSPIRAIALASLRQIGHEILKTLIPGYAKTQAASEGMLFGGAMAFDTVPPEFTWLNTPRNDPCPCGSGKKYKKCHGNPTSR